MSVALDKIENATVRQDARGIEVTRTAHLRNISAAPDRVAAAALYAPGMPRYGDVHPAFPQLRVVDIALAAIDIKQWRATIVYREPSAQERAHALPLGSVIDVQWFSAQVTEDRLFDANGERMFHYYVGRPETLTIIGGNVRRTRSTTRQIGVKSERASIEVPSLGARVTMVESGDPRSRRGFIGKLNSAFWSSEAPKTWVFAGLSGQYENGRWINQYELLWREDTWRLRSVIEFNASPPSDATEGNGIAYFDVRGLANFNQLGFSL